MRVSYEEMKREFKRVLLSRKLGEEDAEMCASMFADTTETGVMTHGVIRFPRFIGQIDAGDFNLDAQPECVVSLGALEQWDAHMAIGNITARKANRRAMELADQYGIGLVALRNANHWMRGGTYAYEAAEKGYMAISFCNSLPIVTPWGGTDARMGTNPIIFAVPGNPPTLLDMATSQYSFGALDLHRLAGKQLEVDGGFDENGKLTRDPATIIKTKRLLPMGYWKGSGLGAIIDMMSAVLAGGKTSKEFLDQGSESSVCEIFIVMKLEGLGDKAEQNAKIQGIVDWITGSPAIDPEKPVFLPGHEFPKKLADNRKRGYLEISDEIWSKIKAL